MSWEERPFERCVHKWLTDSLSAEGESLWVKYLSTRNDIIENILPHISKVEPDLTDHSDRHIVDVIDNAALLIGLKNDFKGDIEDLPHDFSASEMFVLLIALVMHDIGNILKRYDHGSKVIEVWSKLTSWNIWAPNERNIIIDICRAHSGKSKDGSFDTIKDLAVSRRYFFKNYIRISVLAAIVRFADELAEGEHRTSHFLQKNGLIKDDSQIFHEYARCTRVSFDREMGRIALTYHVEVNGSAVNKVQLRKLLKVIYVRALKLNAERQLARYYVDCFNKFRETSISLQIERYGKSLLPLPLDPLILNEIHPNLQKFKTIEDINCNYKISSLIKSIS